MGLKSLIEKLEDCEWELTYIKKYSARGSARTQRVLFNTSELNPTMLAHMVPEPVSLVGS